MRVEEAWAELDQAMPKEMRKGAYSLAVAWQQLREVHQRGHKHLRPVIGPFHVICALLLEADDQQLATAGDDPRLVRRELIQWLIGLCKKPAFWSDVNRRPDGSKFFESETPEEFLDTLWRGLGEASRPAVGFLEQHYRLLSVSASWLLQRFDVVRAFSVLRQAYPWWQAVLRIALSLPLVAGVLVGWLFALEGDSAVRFALSPVLAASSAAFLIQGLLLVAGSIATCVAFVWAAHASRQGERALEKALGLAVVGLGFSLAVGGLFTIVCGWTWLTWDGSVPVAWWRFLFALLWSPIALLIGIVAQVYWTGRAVSDPAWDEAVIA